MSELVLDVDKVINAYLSERAVVVGHPFRRVNFEKRPDYAVFVKLFARLRARIPYEDLNKFMRANRLRLGRNFLPFNLLPKDAFVCYREYLRDGGTEQSYLKKINQSFRNIGDYLYEKDMTVSDFFKKGEIPPVVSEYKRGRIEDVVLVSSGALSPPISFTLRVFLGEKFFDDLDLVRRRISDNPAVQKCLQENFKRIGFPLDFSL